MLVFGLIVLPLFVSGQKQYTALLNDTVAYYFKYQWKQQNKLVFKICKQNLGKDTVVTLAYDAMGAKVLFRRASIVPNGNLIGDTVCDLSMLSIEGLSHAPPIYLLLGPGQTYRYTLIFNDVKGDRLVFRDWLMVLQHYHNDLYKRLKAIPANARLVEPRYEIELELER